MRNGTRFVAALGATLLAMIAGCSHIPGLGKANTTVAATHLGAMTLQLGDMPSGFLIASDTVPDNAQLARQLGMPASAATLDHLGRRAGTLRAFVFTLVEPSTINGPTQATVEVDLFDTPPHAQDWLTMRQNALAVAGPIVPVGVPGQRHFARMMVQHGEAVTMTNGVLAFTEQNVYVEIASVLLGPGPSLAENERYADLIDTRILQG